MGGLLIFEDRNLPVKLLHKITSDDARMLLGTIYLPVGSLISSATMRLVLRGRVPAAPADTEAHPR